MTDQFTTSMLESVVAKICQTIGYSRTKLSAVQVLTGVTMEYMKNLCTGAHRYAELAGRTQPMLSDFEAIFRDLGIKLEEMVEYIQNVGEIPPPIEVPLYPEKKENHLNFLRPGSNEVILRPLHIHEHLPPQFPELESKPILPVQEPQKKTLDKPSAPNHKKSKDVLRRTIKKREGRPLREIKSILMTRSGFLSSSCEGKLPQVLPPEDKSDNVRDLPRVVVTNITSTNLLAAKGLKKGKRPADSPINDSQKFIKISETSSITGSSFEKNGDALRKKMLENYETIRSGSQIIDKSLENLLLTNNKKCIKNTNKSLHEPGVLMFDECSSKGLRDPEEISGSDVNMLQILFPAKSTE